MEPNFELFEEGERSQAASGVHVTLNKECKLFFNRLAVEALGEPDGVALLFDKRKKIIGVRPSALAKKHAYRLRPFSRGSRSKRITIKNFCRRYGLQPSGTLAFPSAAVNRDGVLVLDLQDVKTVKGRW